MNSPKPKAAKGSTRPIAAAKRAQIERSFDAQTMMATLGAQILELAEGHCVLGAPIAEGLRQQHGFGHAALTFALGDVAAGYAALSRIEDGMEVLTAEMKINLIAPCTGGPLRAVGKVIKAGRRLVITQSEVFVDRPEGETLIALLQGTMVPAKSD